MIPPDPADQAKRLARDHARAVRAAAHAAAGDRAGADLARHGMAALGPVAGAVAAGYWPIRTELDPRPLMAALAGAGRTLALPLVVAKDRPLEFRLWRPDEPLFAGAFGTLGPAADAPVVEPDILLVPLLAFDRQRRRLGYGGGFYDRTLALLRSRKTIAAYGIGFAAQEIDRVPAAPWDQVLDGILTEAGVVV